MTFIKLIQLSLYSSRCDAETDWPGLIHGFSSQGRKNQQLLLARRGIVREKNYSTKGKDTHIKILASCVDILLRLENWIFSKMECVRATYS
jgi:hypothetical protein